MAEKVPTTMVLTVDLHCHRCYKKVKKVLCEFPQIQDQVYDEKQNTVTIKVVCCCPEKIKQKIFCKGGDSIKSIEIKPPKPVTPKKQDPPPVPGFPLLSTVCVCFGPWPWGPCFHCRPPPCSGSSTRPGCDSYGCGCGCGGYRPCHMSRCDYFSQENPSGCGVM